MMGKAVEGFTPDGVLHLVAPAKVNLTLEIVGRRDDGYHLLESVMQSIDLGDVLTVRLHADNTEVRTNGNGVPNGDTNLAARAVAALQARVGTTYGQLPGLQVDIDKQIPVAAGLGGGSADAAAALVAANTLWNVHLDKDTLADVGVSIGADVPFCLHGGTAVARGIGERLTVVDGVGDFAGVVVNPGFPVETVEVYRRFSEETRLAPGSSAHTSSGRADAMVAALQAGDAHEVARLLYNELESVTTRMHPEIGELRRRVLQAGAVGAVMCGSGPSVFGLARDVEHAAVLAARLQGTAPYVGVARFSSRDSHVVETGETV